LDGGTAWRKHRRVSKVVLNGKGYGGPDATAFVARVETSTLRDLATNPLLLTMAAVL
jgi:hypothetical protein